MVQIVPFSTDRIVQVVLQLDLFSGWKEVLKEGGLFIYIPFDSFPGSFHNYLNHGPKALLLLIYSPTGCEGSTKNGFAEHKQSVWGRPELAGNATENEIHRQKDFQIFLN